jgi:hypothetical protein
MIAEKELGVKTRDEVMALGIDTYNEYCRSLVMRYSGEWMKIIPRMGRWIDFENDYKTMDTNFMESVWWVFKTLWEKKLVYRGFKVRAPPPSSPCRCDAGPVTTPAPLRPTAVLAHGEWPWGRARLTRGGGRR